jgi:excinuclease ABC subunit C
MTSQELAELKLPDAPGVYFFKNAKREILYVGKATSLKDRVKSYFQTPQLLKSRGERLVEMVELATTVEYLSTESVLEALIMEAHEIQKHQPRYNVIGKDNRSFSYVVITDEPYPRVRVVRGREISYGSDPSLKNCFVAGPFPHPGELREALKIIRRIFPYRDDKCIPFNEQRDPAHPKACWNYQIGLCPGSCVGAVSKQEYRKTVRWIRLFFQGKKGELTKQIEKSMLNCAKEHKFEEAAKLKRTLYALEHIQDIALIKRDIERVETTDRVRIEAFDIAHISGTSTVGVMTVVEDGELEKSQYRKFRIRGAKGKVSVDDTGNLKEVLRRRFNHPEWTLPQIIVVDGGVAQINAAVEVLKELGVEVEVVSVVKDNRHKAREILGNQEIVRNWGKSITLVNSEAHRFAIGYHRKLRGKGFRI